jgi:hypothetical protein
VHPPGRAASEFIPGIVFTNRESPMIQIRSRHPLAGLGLLALVSLGACSDSVEPDPSNNPPAATPGAVEVVITTTGENPDADGYTVAVGSAAAKPLAANGSVKFEGITAGSHRLVLGGLANNCSVGGANPRDVTVAASATTKVTLAVTCVAKVGTVEISVATTGDDVDADGYTVALDGGSPQALGVNGTVSLSGVGIGARTVTIDGIAANCRLTGDAARAVTVGENATVSVAYQIACLPLPTAQNGAFTASEAEDVTIDLATLTDARGQGGVVYSLGAISNAGFTAQLAGSVVTISSPDGDGNGAVSLPFTITTDAGSASAAVNGTVAAMTDYHFTLKEVFGDSVITAAASIEIDGVSHDFVNGVIEGQIEPGVHTFGLVQHAGTFDAQNISLSSGAERVLFGGLPQDTISLNQDFTGVIRRPSTSDANFNWTHYLDTYDSPAASIDNPFKGQQAPRGKTITVWIQTRTDLSRNCLDATPTTIQQMRALQANIKANIESTNTYEVVVGEGGVAPARSDSLLVICTSNALAVGITYGGMGQFDGGIAYVLHTGANPERELIQLGNSYPFGAIEYNSGCDVESVFTEESACNDAGKPENIAADATLYDKHEGLVMGYWFARPAAKRHLASGGSVPYFTLRP